MTAETTNAAAQTADDDALLGALEAIMTVTAEPLTEPALAQSLGVSVEEIHAALEHLSAEYRGSETTRPRGFELRQGPAGWRLYSAPQFRGVVTDFLTAGQTAKLSQAALETLAVIAYRQPVTRARISAIRGVNVDGVVRTLVMRGLIVEAGAEGTSGAQQFVTTPEFLESTGLSGLEDLPDIAPFLPDGEDVPREE